MTNIQSIAWLDIGWIALLLGISGLISFGLRLRMEKRLYWASARTIIQLIAVGFILDYIFKLNRWYLVIGILIVMMVLAVFHSTSRSQWSYRGSFWISLLSLSLGTTVSAFIVTQLIVEVTPWYSPQYVIPLVGMILGNSLNGISLGVDRFLGALVDEKALIEERLFLGATSWEAALPSIRKAVFSGHIPILNSMAIAGIISLPGMMTGQILSGVSPFLAARYQIVVMFMIATACSLGTTTFVALSARRLFTPWHQIDSDRIKKKA